MKTIFLFLADGFEEIEALTQVDLLRRAKISVATVGIGKKEITGAHGITVEADITDSEALNRINETEMMILPGGMPGTKNLDASPAVHRFIEYCDENKLFISAICAAPSVLGKRGILKNRKAICYPGYENELTGAEICDTQAVRDGTIITARGPGAAVDFALLIVKALKGEAAADEIRRQIII